MNCVKCLAVKVLFSYFLDRQSMSELVCSVVCNEITLLGILYLNANLTKFFLMASEIRN